MADDFHCSFCGQPRRAVRKLISGPRVFICEACVLTCIQTASAAEEGETGHVVPMRTTARPSGSQDKLPSCSFCGKPHRDSRLAVRCFDPEFPERAICAECIGLCVDILAEECPDQLTEEARSWPEATRQKGDRRPTCR
jgi:ATP-dependent protease Clp ATPase subunit